MPAWLVGDNCAICDTGHSSSRDAAGQPQPTKCQNRYSQPMQSRDGVILNLAAARLWLKSSDNTAYDLPMTLKHQEAHNPNICMAQNFKTDVRLCPNWALAAPILVIIINVRIHLALRKIIHRLRSPRGCLCNLGELQRP